jgi:transcriptional regulator with XRE-family HTH domain
MTTERNIVSQLSRRRKMLGMSCQSLAARCGVSMPTVQRVLSGEMPPRFPTLVAIAGALGAQIGITVEETPGAMRERTARNKASHLVSMAQGTSALEAQAVADDALADATEQVTRQLLAGPARRLWAK